MAACSAVFISPTQALSANHCVADSTGNMWVKDSKGNSYTAKVAKKNKYMDLCLITIIGPEHDYVKLGKPVNVGDKVYTLNNGDDMANTFNEGLVSNIVIDNDTHILTIVHTTGILPGASGSGLFNAKGELIGINTMADPKFTYSVDVAIIDAFLGAPTRRP